MLTSCVLSQQPMRRGDLRLAEAWSHIPVASWEAEELVGKILPGGALEMNTSVLEAGERRE